MKVALVTNIPAPYRIPVLNQVANAFGDNFTVVFCTQNEPNRQWNLTDIKFRHVYLKKSYTVSRGTYIHNNFDILKVLKNISPDVIITTGFNPTYLYAWGYSLFAGISHIPMTDGWELSERSLTSLHRIIRHIVFRTSQAFIGASKKSLELYRSYGISTLNLFQSHLCIDNDRFRLLADTAERPYDIMYSGQIIDRKMPDFFVEVVCEVKKTIPNLRVLIIGNGALREKMLNNLADAGIEVDYAGFVAQEELPKYYSMSKLLLFTTSNDPWGIVANEALASGTPVITSKYSGVTDDLVVNNWNGYVLENNVTVWASNVIDILTNSSLWMSMHTNANNSLREHTFDNAAKGIIAAAQWAFSHPRNLFRSNK